MKLPPNMHISHAQRDAVKRAADHVVREATRVMVKRDDTTSSSKSSSTCKAGDSSGLCETPASRENVQNIAIALGVVVPLLIAAVILAILHRRLRKKQRQEDLHDPHKSLDFGMDGVEPAHTKKAKKGKMEPEMSVQEISGHGRPKRTPGLSMDMNIGSPYMLPPGLNGSHESIHSMARTHDEHDPYRPVTLLRPSTDGGSIRTGRFQGDNGSLYSMSTGHHSALQDKAGLLANARPMSQTIGKRADSMSPQEQTSPVDFPPRQMHSSMNRNVPPPIRKPSLDKTLPELMEKDLQVASREALPSPSIVINEPTLPEPVAKELPTPPRMSDTTSSSSVPTRGDSMLTTDQSSRPESSNYGDDGRDSLGPHAPHHAVTVTDHDEPYDIDPIMIYTEYEDDDLPSPNALPQRKQSLAAPVAAAPAGTRLSVMGVRPLPPDMPEDNPEIRANRIRSFYKEYFDDSKPAPANAQYTEPGYVYDDGYLDGIVYDPDTGGFFAPGQHAKPWAQGPARRAMTPPPRARPRVSDNSSTGFQYHSRRPSMAYSTMSGGGRPRGRTLPKKMLPPPAALNSLPTPHKLRENDMVFNPIDFAPPSSFRELQNGRRADSPLGVVRPYSPSVRAFTPLASSFDALDVLPSPHHLRRSGTFTALDFAPPSKLRDPNGPLSPSDAGSIRSNRSGISAMQHHAVRDGAYRVSRIPKEMVTTRDDLANQLRPTLDMVSKA